jgi:cellulose synthase/poly-beta-1,6-N-acetylglucosamine synthase-like glycosyltransferase
MPKNMGSADRIIRFIIAVVLAILIFVVSMSQALKIILGIITIIFIVTSIFGTCPLYIPFRISTKGKKIR